jgi:hypothetical protein
MRRQHNLALRGKRVRGSARWSRGSRRPHGVVFRIVILMAGTIPAVGAGALLSATPAAASVCPFFPTGTLFGTWVDSSNTNGGVVNAVDSANLMMQTTFGTFSFITGNLPLFPGSTVSGTINPDCSFQGSVDGFPVDTYTGWPIDLGPNSSAANGTWHDSNDHGSWTAAIVAAQTSNPSTNSLSLGSSGDPIQVSVASPTTGPISISTTGSLGGATLPNYSVLGGLVVISAPDGSANSPLTLTFTLTSTLAASSIVLFKNGVAVPACSSTSPIAPDPCEESASGPSGSPSADTITVLTSSASIWAFGAKCGFSIPTTNLPFALVNQHYSASLTGCGGKAPYVFKKVGRLPRGLRGLSLSRTGVLSGTLTSTGTFSFRVKMTDATTPRRLKHTTTKTFSITSL